MTMRRSLPMVLITAVALALTLATAAAAKDEVAGVLSLSPATAQSCLAVRVALPDSGTVLSGFRWYNHDPAAAFAEVLVAAVDSSGAPDLAGALAVATDVAGGQDTWSECWFDPPVSSTVGDVYLVLRFPGEGPAPGVGYALQPGGAATWATADGVQWTRVSDQVSLCVAPEVGAKALGEVAVFSGAAVPRWETALAAPAPNPFNPRTELRFTLARAGRVRLVLYDLAGRRVRELVSGELPAGPHAVTWRGEDDAGRRLGSGVYLARLQAGGTVQTRRLVMVR